MPIPLDGGDSILFRPAIPFIVDQPMPFGATGYAQESGLGDITFDLAYAPKSEDGILVAYGIISTLPTGDEDLGMGESTTLGPEYLIGKITPNYVIGAFPNHQWDIAGDRKVNITSSQFFGILLPGDGWSYGTSPTVSYNWESEQWTVPVQVTASKTVIWGGRPWKFGMEVNYYVEKDDYFAPEWMIGFSITPVVENKLLAWFKS
ncbi:hypothetical protein RI844_06320 [Thalassotalea fonticola]|uniref:Transporter n=1 Tax=Thalassotalea fonticola TaxID=3065649 RepID=A0ABZ0GSS3_9GAMM|nr:hypothetical protein RI844_06320 [Colwelliaceae bacterium S1-1]